MKCTNPECGADNPEGARFCRICGVKIEEKPQMVSCPKCGRANPVGFSICRKCGYEPVELKCPNCGNTDLEDDDAFCWKCKAKLNIGGGSKPYSFCQVGAHFCFGSYPQTKNGEVKPIEWRVLARETDRLLVIAEYGLDAKAFNEEYEDTTWLQCSLRAWLNGDFMEEAFTAEEQAELLEVNLGNTGDSEDGNIVPVGTDTSDKLFLLSVDEAERYFAGDAERCCKPTDYALEQGADVSDNANYTGNCWWWLRSPGGRACSVADVDSDGSVSSYIQIDDYAVRPAMYLSI